MLIYYWYKGRIRRIPDNAIQRIYFTFSYPQGQRKHCFQPKLFQKTAFLEKCESHIAKPKLPRNTKF